MLQTENQRQELAEFCKRKLMYYMMPKHTVILDSFPTNTSGKADTRALPDPPTLVKSFCLSQTTPMPIGSTSTGESVSLAGGKYVALRSHRTLAKFICETIAATRGGEIPSEGSSFAAIGVDSVGAIIFVRQLSASLDNVAIDLATIFGGGVTIRTFADGMMKKLRDEKPAVACRFLDPDLEDPAEESSGLEDSPAEQAFNDRMLANRTFLNGLRGLLAVMVLYDHYPAYPKNLSIKCDAYLFILLSGLASSLELRETPKYAVIAKGEYQLQPRPRFDWFRFLLTRWLGILPMAWLSLVLFAPFWYWRDEGSREQSNFIPSLHQTSDNALCTLLYVFAAETFFDPNCVHGSGPAFTRYASLLNTSYMLYAIFRLGLVKFQNELMAWREPGLILLHSNVAAVATDTRLVSSIRRNPNRTWSQYIGNSMTMLAYSRYDSLATVLPTAVVVSAAVLVAVSPILGVTAHLYATSHVFHETLYNYIEIGPYFLLGAGTASFIEHIHYRLWSGNCSNFGDKDLSSMQTKKDEAMPTTATKKHRITCGYIINFLLQYPMEFIIVFFIFCLTSIGGIDNYPTSDILRFVVLPILASVFIILSYFPNVFSSSENIKYGIKKTILRQIFESAPLQILGYCSYPLYLFQRYFLEYIMVYLIPSTRGLSPVQIPLYYKTIFIILCICFSWCVQKYFQDTFVIFIYSKIRHW